MKRAGLIIMIILIIHQPLMAQWSPVRFDEHNLFKKAFTATPSTVFLAGVIPANGGSFIMRTNNGGTTWDSIVVNTGPNFYQFSSLFFADVNTGYAGGYNNAMQGMMKTTDNGTTWSDITPDPLSTSQISAIYFVNPLSGFASNGSVLYSTVNGGVSWASIAAPFTITDICFSDMSNGYASGSSGGIAIAMKTNDGGASWMNSLSVPNPFMSPASIAKSDIISQDEIVVSLQYTNFLYRTVTGGASWDTIEVPLIYEIQDFDFISATTGRVVSSMGEIFVTYDAGATWTLEYATSTGAYGPNVFLYSLSFSGTTGYVAGSNGLVKKFPGTTGIDEQEFNNVLFLYPNPAGSSSELTFMVPTEGYNFQLAIFNSIGQEIINTYLDVDRNQSQVTLKNQGLQAGFYAVVLRNEIEIFTARLVIAE